MKIRNGHISNSSASSFIITNLTNETKTLLDFAKETLYLLKEFSEEYGDKEMEGKAQEELERTFLEQIENVENHINYEDIPPNEVRLWAFADGNSNWFGRVYDYMLRDNAKTESFDWEFAECRGEIMPKMKKRFNLLLEVQRKSFKKPKSKN